jgi:hypothetical protein
MRSIGPAGWGNHGYFGLHARTFGNPEGASSGGGAWTGALVPGGDSDALPAKARRDGGKNVNGPNQGGGGGGGGGTNWTGYSDLNVGSTGLYGGGDDGFWDITYGNLTGSGGHQSTPIPAGAKIAGAPVVALAFTSSDWESNEAIIVAVLGTVAQNAFTSITFATTAHPTPVTYFTADAQAFSHAEPTGYTVWSFAPINAFPFGEGPDPITVTVV